MLLIPGSIDLSNVLPWISQYTEYLISTRPIGTQRSNSGLFTYDSGKPFKGQAGRKVDFLTLDSVVIGAEQGSPIRVFADRWNNVMVAKVRYTKESTLASWRALLEAQDKVAMLVI
jgi:hypothetical protein